MKCTFAGVGSAFDAGQTNTSILIESTDSSILLDCGFNAGHSFARISERPADLDLLWISHFHGDHFFGIPFLIGYLFSSGRTRDFMILGPAGVEEKVISAIELAYPSLLAKLPFRLVFEDVAPGDQLCRAGFEISFCSVEHSQSALSVRVGKDGAAVFYSGDGRMLAESKALAKGADLGIMEAYYVTEQVQGHFTVQECIDFATLTEMKQVALVHMDHSVRTCKKDEIVRLLNKYESIEAVVPEEGQSFLLGETDRKQLCDK